MEKKNKNASSPGKPEGIQRQIFKSQLILIISLTVILAAAGGTISIVSMNKARDLNLANTAQLISAHCSMSGSDDVTALTDYMDCLRSTLKNIDVISIVDSDRNRLYHTNHELIGTKYDGTIPDISRLSGGSYSESSTGPSGNQRRAYALVDFGNGKYGFVITIMLETSIRLQVLEVILLFLAVAVIAVLVELVISNRVSKKIKNRLFGYEPEMISAMFMTRENILESISEGVVALNEKKEIEFVNRSAAGILGLDGNNLQAMTENQKEFVIGMLDSTLTSGETECGLRLTSDTGFNFILDRLPVKKDSNVIGAVGILHDRSEYEKLAEDLAGTRFLVDSMRANNHDFTNKLHVILGLLQIGMTDQAMSYIENITIVQRESVTRVMHAIDNSAVAALLIGKIARASECNVKFHLREDSFYSVADVSLPNQALITIIGNLIDNAIDSMNEWGSEKTGSNELVFGIYSRKNALLITVDDTGRGIPAELKEKVFENGFSTKGTGRGIGLFHTRELVESLGGTISFESEAGKGTSFTVCFEK